MANGNGGPSGQRGTGRHGIEHERSVAGARGLEPPVQLQRQPSLPPAAPRPGQVDPEWVTRQENVGRWIQRRERFLENLTRLLRSGAPSQFASPRLAQRQAELNRLEAQFRRVMERYQSNPRPLSAADRREALRIHDAAYDVSGRGWNRARQEFWQGLYNSPQGRRLIDAARREGMHGLPMIQISEAEMRRGRAPRILDFDAEGRPRYVTVDIDHMTPRERNPFHAFRPDNLRLQSERFNRRWLNRFSESTRFPMGRYGRPDAIEEFVQSHQLSRRQRPEAERPRRSRRSGRAGRAATGGIAGILTVLFAADRQRDYAEAADRLRRASRRRQEARRQPPIPPNSVDAYNVALMIERVFLRSPLEVDLSRAEQLRRAVETWVRREYRQEGSGWNQFESRLAEARSGSDLDALNRLLFEVGHVQLRDLSGLVLGDLSQVSSSATQIDAAMRMARNLLADRATYLRRAEEADRLSQAQADALEMEAQALGITLNDMMTIYDQSRGIANHYRGYVYYLESILDLLAEAARVTEARFRRIQAAIDEAEAARAR